MTGERANWGGRMFKGISQYFAGIGLAMRVRAGKGEAYAERLKAYGELSRVDQVNPAAQAEVQVAAKAIVTEAVMAEMRSTPIADLKHYGAAVGPLQAASFQTVSDLIGHTLGSLQGHRGIGEVTAGFAMLRRSYTYTGDLDRGQGRPRSIA